MIPFRYNNALAVFSLYKMVFFSNAYVFLGSMFTILKCKEDYFDSFIIIKFRFFKNKLLFSTSDFYIFRIKDKINNLVIARYLFNKQYLKMNDFSRDNLVLLYKENSKKDNFSTVKSC